MKIQHSYPVLARAAIWLTLSAAAPLIGCGDDDDDGASSSSGSGGKSGGAGTDGGKAGAKAGGAGGAAAGSGGAGKPAVGGATDEDAGTPSGDPKDAGSSDNGDHIYAYTVETETGGFITLTKAVLPEGAPELAPEKAREFSGWTYFMGGQALTANGAEAVQTKINDDLTFSEGAVLSLADYPLSDGEVNWFFAWQADDHHVFMNYDLTSRLVFDPIEMKVLGTKEDSKIENTFEGLRLDNAGNRSGLKSPDQPTQMAYFYRDEDWWKFGSKSIIGFYDNTTFEEIKRVEIPCPGLAVASRDEEGNTYWGTWDYKGVVAAYGMGPWPCIARIDAKGQLDEAFTTDLRDLTGGLSHRMFQYVRDGWGVMAVWDHKQSGLDFENPQPADNAFDLWWNGPGWSVWKVDVKNKKAEPFPGITQPVNPEIQVKKVGDKIFFSVASEEYTKYTWYELNADDTLTSLPEPKGFWDLVR